MTLETVDVVTERAMTEAQWVKLRAGGPRLIGMAGTAAMWNLAELRTSSRGVHDLSPGPLKTASDLRGRGFSAVGVDQSCAIDL